jgi:hypothetical protein
MKVIWKIQILNDNTKKKSALKGKNILRTMDELDEEGKIVKST